MKKNLMALAVASIALTFSCTGNKTAQEASENDFADSLSAANNELDWQLLLEHTKVCFPQPTVRVSKRCSPLMPTAPISCARIISTARTLTTRQAAFCMCSTAVC